MKIFNGKAIYQPKGKAKEYAEWACNFYVGCSNGCEYCYLKKGRGAATLGGYTPTLKKCFRDEVHALEIFEKELKANLMELRKYGLFFSFTTDPMLLETAALTALAVDICISGEYKVPVKILTKETWWVKPGLSTIGMLGNSKLIAYGFTLTGHDNLERNAPTNESRIDAMRQLHEAGFKTFASIEPIIDFPSAKRMIEASLGFCDLYKVGLMSGKKYNVVEAQSFVEWLNSLNKPKIYLKESLQKLLRYTNDELDKYFVNRDYRLHEVPVHVSKRFLVTYCYTNRTDASLHEDEVEASNYDEACNKVCANHNYEVECHAVEDAS